MSNEHGGPEVDRPTRDEKNPPHIYIDGWWAIGAMPFYLPCHFLQQNTVDRWRYLPSPPEGDA